MIKLFIAGGILLYAFFMLFAYSLCAAAARGNEFDEPKSN